MKEIKVQCQGIPYGGMVWWKKIDDAARYLIYLYIVEKEQNSLIYNEIACVEKDRQTLYHTFEGLAKIDREVGYSSTDYYSKKYTNLAYYVSVAAEDRVGNIIGESTKTELVPLEANGRI